MKGRKKREAGGVNEAAEDLKSKPEARTDAKKIDSEAEEMKKGGRAKRKEGGKVDGMKAMHHAGRKPRKSGGRATSDANPFTSARSGKMPPGHKTEAVSE
jgi:hypothetical protein